MGQQFRWWHAGVKRTFWQTVLLKFAFTRTFIFIGLLCYTLFLLISSMDTFMKITIQYFFTIITWQRRIVGRQYGPNHLVLFKKSSPDLYVICLMSRWTMILRSISDAMKNYNVKQNQISWPTIIWFNSWNWRSSTEKLKAATAASEGFYGSSTRINSVTIISIGFRCCIYSYIPILLLCSCWCLCHLFPKKPFGMVVLG